MKGRKLGRRRTILGVEEQKNKGSQMSRLLGEREFDRWKGGLKRSHGALGEGGRKIRRGGNKL